MDVLLFHFIDLNRFFFFLFFRQTRTLSVQCLIPARPDFTKWLLSRDQVCIRLPGQQLSQPVNVCDVITESSPDPVLNVGLRTVANR